MTLDGAEVGEVLYGIVKPIGDGDEDSGVEIRPRKIVVDTQGGYEETFQLKVKKSFKILTF